MMSKSIETRIHTIFFERAPNPLTIDNLNILLSDDVSTDEINLALQQLIDKKIIIKVIGNIKDSFSLSSYEGIPVKKYIDVGGVKVPRRLNDDLILPEDANIFFEVLAKKVALTEDNIEKKVEEKMKSYWANIIVLFGIFIGLFALIITFVQKVELKSGETFCNVFLLNLAQVLPLALVLAGFVWLLKKLFK